jgi:DNA-binding NarL/FixJ family response regulator
MPRRATKRLGVCVISSHALALDELTRSLRGPGFRALTLRAEELRPPEPSQAAWPGGNASGGSLPEAAVYVMDANAPRPIAESRIADVLAAQPEARLVVTAEKFTEADALSLLRMGVRGLLNYSEARQRLPEAVRSVAGGGYWVPRALLGRFVDAILGKKGAPVAPVGRVAGARARMSKREQQVLDALLENLANKEIAVRLNISERTVKFHVSNLLAKFGVRRRADLILLSYQSGARP